MKIHLNEVLDTLGIDSFTPSTHISSTPGKVREYFTKRIGGTSFMLMSNEFTLDKNGKKIGAPNPDKDIWCTILDKKDDKFELVIQYSNKEGVSSMAKEDTTYTRK
jgi:hypothetical protein